jgi:hypothetical protein
MARVVKLVGLLLIASGLALSISFVMVTIRQEDYQKALMLMERNPGNVMYESQYFVAAVWRAMYVGLAACGALAALNGVTFLLVGAVAGRQERQAQG